MCPLVDEKVARVVSSGPTEHLVTERLMFETLCRLGPPRRNLSLYDARCRFEAHKPRAVMALPPLDPAKWPAPKGSRA
jgi:hypothetical protein